MTVITVVMTIRIIVIILGDCELSVPEVAG